MENEPASRPKKIERRPAVQARVGLSCSKMYAKIADGTFPRPVRLSEGKHGAVGWLSTEIDDWIDSRPRVSA